MGNFFDDDDDEDEVGSFGLPKPRNSVEVDWGKYISNQAPSVLLLEEIESEAAHLVEEGVFRDAYRMDRFQDASMDIEGHPKEPTGWRRFFGHPVVPTIQIWVRDEATIELATFGNQNALSPRRILDVISVRGDPETQAVEVCDRLKLLLLALAQ